MLRSRYLKYAVENLEDNESEALKNDQAVLKALSWKIINTPLDELDEEVAQSLIDEIRWPYETIHKIFMELAEQNHYIKIDNSTKLDTNKHPLYAKLQSAIDELNRRDVIIRKDNSGAIEVCQDYKELIQNKVKM